MPGFANYSFLSLEYFNGYSVIYCVVFYRPVGRFYSHGYIYKLPQSQDSRRSSHSGWVCTYTYTVVNMSTDPRLTVCAEGVAAFFDPQNGGSRRASPRWSKSERTEQKGETNDLLHYCKDRGHWKAECPLKNSFYTSFSGPHVRPVALAAPVCDDSYGISLCVSSFMSAGGTWSGLHLGTVSFLRFCL